MRTIGEEVSENTQFLSLQLTRRLTETVAVFTIEVFRKTIKEITLTKHKDEVEKYRGDVSEKEFEKIYGNRDIQTIRIPNEYIEEFKKLALKYNVLYSSSKNIDEEINATDIKFVSSDTFKIKEIHNILARKLSLNFSELSKISEVTNYNLIKVELSQYEYELFNLLNKDIIHSAERTGSDKYTLYFTEDQIEVAQAQILNIDQFLNGIDKDSIKRSVDKKYDALDKFKAKINMKSKDKFILLNTQKPSDYIVFLEDRAIYKEYDVNREEYITKELKETDIDYSEKVSKIFFKFSLNSTIEVSQEKLNEIKKILEKERYNVDSEKLTKHLEEDAILYTQSENIDEIFAKNLYTNYNLDFIQRFKKIGKRKLSREENLLKEKIEFYQKNMDYEFKQKEREKNR